MSGLLDFSSPEMHQNHIFQSFAPHPTGRAYSTPLDFLSVVGRGLVVPPQEHYPVPSPRGLGL